jgi:hypothetical protein
MISVVCPACGKSLTAPVDRAGKRARCPGCGAPVGIPAVASSASPPPLPARDAFDADEMIADARPERFGIQGAAAIEDAAEVALLRGLSAELQLCRGHLAEVVKHTKRTGQWVMFWSILALLPFFFWTFAFLVAFFASRK